MATNKIAVVALAVGILALIATYYVYTIIPSDGGSGVYYHAYAKAAPTTKGAAMASTNWQIVSSSNLTMNNDGTVTLPGNGMYNITGTQENKINGSAIGVRLTYSDGKTQVYWQSVPSSGIENSPITVSVTTYAVAGTKVAIVYNWGTGTTVQAASGPQTIFTVSKFA